MKKCFTECFNSCDMKRKDIAIYTSERSNSKITYPRSMGMNSIFRSTEWEDRELKTNMKRKKGIIKHWAAIPNDCGSIYPASNFLSFSSKEVGNETRRTANNVTMQFTDAKYKYRRNVLKDHVSNYLQRCRNKWITFLNSLTGWINKKENEMQSYRVYLKHRYKTFIKTVDPNQMRMNRSFDEVVMEMVLECLFYYDTMNKRLKRKRRLVSFSDTLRTWIRLRWLFTGFQVT